MIVLFLCFETCSWILWLLYAIRNLISSYYYLGYVSRHFFVYENHLA